MRTSPKFTLIPLAVLASLVSSVAFSANYYYRIAVPNMSPNEAVACETPWGSSVSPSSMVFAYSAEIVPFGTSCDTVKQARTCSDGVLSGTFTHAECEVGPEHPASCKDILIATPGSPSGQYTIDPDGTGPETPLSAYCDMTSSGGGWTRVVRQYESTPVAWTGGSNGSAYALSQAQIPAHTEVGFGKDNVATFAAQVTMQYSTGTIALATVSGPGGDFHVHRDYAGFHASFDPDSAYYKIASNPGLAQYRDTLTINKVGLVSTNGWAFNSGNPSQAVRGYTMGDTYTGGSLDAYAWSVWVR